MRKILFPIVLLILVWGSIEVLSWAGLAAFKHFKSVEFAPFSSEFLYDHQKEIIRKLLAGENQYTDYHAVLGWTVKPSAGSEPYQSNSQGVRSVREYTSQPATGKTRIVAYGDSFTHGDEIPNDQTWTHYLEQGDTTIDALNLGVGGYGLDQAYLRYQLHENQFSADIVLIGYMVNNVERTVNTFRPFYTEKSGLPLTKPRFTLEEGRLKLIPNPIQDLSEYRALLNEDPAMIRRISEHDFYYKKKYFAGPFDTLPSVRLVKVLKREYRQLINEREKQLAFDINEQIFVEFADLAQRYGSRPIVLIFPTKYDFYRKRLGHECRYQNVIDTLEVNQLEYIDMIEAFDLTNPEFPIEDMFAPYKHYSGQANQRIARYILSYLKTTGTTVKPN